MSPVTLPSEKRSLRGRLGRFFYAEEVPYGIALVRMFLPIGLMVAMLPRWFRARELYSSDGATTPLHNAYGVANMLPEFSGVVAVGMATLLILTLITMAVGWCTRASTTIAFITYTYLNLIDAVSTMTKYSVIASHVLLLLSLSHCGAVWSVDRWLERRKRVRAGLPDNLAEPKFAAWPRRLMQLLIGYVYFGAAITKFHTPAYFTSDQLGTWMQTNVNYANPVGEWMTQFSSLLVLFAYIAVVWEILFIFLCWRGTGRLFVVGMGILFHLMTTVTLGLIVFPLVCIAIYCAFLDTNDIQRISAYMKRHGWIRGPQSSEATVEAAAPDTALPTRSLAAFGALAIIVIATGIELEYWMDPYGLRRPEGPYALKELDPELVEQVYFKKSGPVRSVDMIAGFQTGTIMVGGEVFDPRETFRIGDTIVVQAAISQPHPDMFLGCALHDAEDHVLDFQLQPAIRESRRCNFSYKISDALEPGEYSMVLKRTGQEIMRRRITIQPRKNTAAAN